MSRSSSESDPLPPELLTPIAMAEHLQDDSVPKPAPVVQAAPEETEPVSSPTEEKSDAAEPVRSLSHIHSFYVDENVMSGGTCD